MSVSPTKASHRLGLLTLPLKDNYGGMLQIVALYHFLRDEGYLPVLLRTAPARSRVFLVLAALLRRIPLQNIRGVRARYLAKRVHHAFLKRYLPEMTPVLRSTMALETAVRELDLKAFIVGSDQVWRPEYTHGNAFTNYMLDFVPDDVTKLSYAASFGTSEWRHPGLVDSVSELLKRFRYVMVREETGQKICRDTFGRMDAELVLDPTLLMPASFYEEMMPSTADRVEEKCVMKYVLDATETLDVLERHALQQLGAGAWVREIELGAAGSQVTVGAWLRAFYDADFIITDSFHGMVFSVIFRKQFIALVNLERGADRFLSLARQLGLEDRLIIGKERERLPRGMIDYSAVTARLDERRDQSTTALLRAIG